MTPEEKANELIEKFYEPASQMNFNESKGWFIEPEQSKVNAKACAVVCVDEILNSNPISPYPTGYYEKSFQMDAAREYWQQVKSLIQKQ